jgi:hypothetical protein
MARRTSQRIAFLEALTLQEVTRLVGNMVVFWVLRFKSFVVGIKWFAGPISEGMAAMFDGVTVALSTQFDLPLAIQILGMNDVVSGLNLRIRMMKRDVILSRSVTHFTSHAKNETVLVVLID